MLVRISRESILQGAAQLPAFPRIVNQILQYLENEDVGMQQLAEHLQRDPVIAGKVLAMANRILRGNGRQEVRNVYTAASFIGLAKIREIVLGSSLASFTRDSKGSTYFWEHSLAVGIAAQEIGLSVGLSGDSLFVAGLLHDVGQLWLSHFHPREFHRVCLMVENQGIPICQAEKTVFGLDHCEVGRVMAESWELPTEIGLSIFHHHTSHGPMESRLLAAVHVAEVLSHALDLPTGHAHQVHHLSATALARLGLTLDQGSADLFGRIEARFKLAQALFR